MQKPHKLDEIDIAIIQMLQMDGRIPYADIAEVLKLSASTIQQRANRLIKNGQLSIRAVTDPVAVGVPVTATIALRVDGATIGEIAQEVAKFDEVGWVVISSGSFDIITEVACHDNEHLIELISNLAKIEGVRSTETFIYLRIVKNSYQWGLPEGTT
jgi:Lrp/AsnC family transcriptional regulator for asnA, asnC and gidA